MICDYLKTLEKYKNTYRKNKNHLQLYFPEKTMLKN